MPVVTVVIPCYNHGVFLADAVDSVLAQTFADFEIIIVNDGSTDPETIKIINSFDRPGTRVISIANTGLASARNVGIAAATSPYILPLDADDRIGPEYLAKAVTVLERDHEVGIVYCHAEKFGAASGAWELPEFSPKRICFENMIFCSALFRKSDWQNVGGYYTKLRSGWEDWDFWLSLVELGVKVVRLPESMFWYRVSSDSMTRTMGYGQKISAMVLMIARHRKLYFESLKRNG